MWNELFAGEVFSHIEIRNKSIFKSENITMTRIIRLYFLLTVAMYLSGCVPNNAPPPTNTKNTSTALISPTVTTIPTETKPPTQPATLTASEANEKIRNYLQNPVVCSTPCFWGIMPGKTTFSEAINIFTSLGLQPEHTLTENNQEFYDTDYHLEKGFEISIIIAVQDNIIKTLNVGMNVPTDTGVSRKWSGYSPETLINQYGIPSKVEFFLGRVTPTPTHSMVLYFENAELIVSYTGSKLLNSSPQLEICPITNQVEHIRIWVGENKRYPPTQGTPLEDASLLDLQEFAKLMLGKPDDACLNLNSKAFP